MDSFLSVVKVAVGFGLFLLLCEGKCGKRERKNKLKFLLSFLFFAKQAFSGIFQDRT